MRWFLSLSFLLLVATAPAAERPNLLVLVADDLRPDAIAVLGDLPVFTPNLDALAARSLVFTRAVCSYPICHVSRGEMITGRHHWENMEGKNFRTGTVFWPQAFRDAGYATWHVGKWHIPGRPLQVGYTDVAGMFAGGGGKFVEEGQVDPRGFPVTGYKGWVFQSEDGKALHPEFGVGLTPDINDRFADAALSLIRKAGNQPWLCQVNFTAPHDPLFPTEENTARFRDLAIETPANFLPEHPFDHGNLKGRDELLLPFPRTEESVRKLRRDYFAVVVDLDRAVGTILDELKASGAAKNTVVIFTSDHGLAIGSHGLSGKQNAYEHTMGVPLLISGPDIRSGTTAAQVYLRELFPTTCELAGIPTPETVTAESFAPVLRDERDTQNDRVFATFTDTQRAIRTADGWKLIHYPQVDRWQLFDLNNDPLEMEDLSATGHPRFGKLKDELLEWRAKTGDPLLQTP